MKDYTHYYPSRRERLKHKAIKNFEVHYDNGDESYLVDINNDFKKKVIIKAHSNPINEYLEDLKMYYIDDPTKPIRWGDEINGYDDNDGHNYMVVTRPQSNGFSSKCRIRKMYNRIRFLKNDRIHIRNCIMAKGLLYNVTSYVTETEVFEDEDMIAILVRYDDITKQLRMFDNIWFDNDLHYKIVKIDNYTLKERLEDFGILQIVLIKTVFGELTGYRFGEQPFNVVGILRYAKLKERIYNAKAREILTPHDVIKPGDYITHTFPRNPYFNDNIIAPDDYTETRTYIVKSLVDMRNEYDSAFILNCTAEFNIKDEYGDAYTVHAYFEDNSTQLMSNERNTNVFNENSKYKCIVQNNKYTRQLGKEVSRVMIFGDCYEVVGIDKLTGEGIIGVEFVESKINPTLDNFELQIADYYKINYIEDTTSDKEFEILYADPNLWSYLNGYEEILLGERTEFSISYEQKIILNESPTIAPYNIKWMLTYEDGSLVENNEDIAYISNGNKLYIQTKTKVPLLGTKMCLIARVCFEEQIYDKLKDSYTTQYKISEHSKFINVSGW